MHTALLTRRVTAAVAHATRVSVRASGGHGHHDVNPGPPVTFDYIPVPFQPYGVVYSRLQSKFNQYLAVSVVVFLTGCGLMWADDVLSIDTLRPPLSYRNRNKT